MLPGAGADHGGAGDQRPDQLPERDVEADRGLVEDAIVGSEEIAALHPLDPVGQCAVDVQHALRGAGGPGGVDDIGETLWVGGQGGRGGRLNGDRGGVEAEGCGTGEGGVEVGEDDGWAGVLVHPGKAFLGIGGVERQVGAAGFEGRQQADHQLQRAGGEDADAGFGAHSQLLQAMCQLIGAVVEFAVGEARAAIDAYCLGVGGAGGLGFEHPDHVTVGEGGGGGVPAGEPALLGGAQQVDLDEGAIRGGDHRGEDLAEVGHQPLDGGGRRTEVRPHSRPGAGTSSVGSPACS